jgi:hypothetical protein
MLRLRFMAPLFVVAAVGGGVLMGDDKAEPIVVSVQMPKYYSKLSLTPKQRNDILKIRAKYASELQELEQKIRDMKKLERRDYEKVLTAAQKSRLQELLGGKKDADDDDPPVQVDKKKTTAAKDKK